MLPAPPRPVDQAWRVGEIDGEGEVVSVNGGEEDSARWVRELELDRDRILAREAAEGGPVASGPGVVVVSLRETTFPAPPREVCMAGLPSVGVDGCGSTTR